MIKLSWFGGRGIKGLAACHMVGHLLALRYTSNPVIRQTGGNDYGR